MIVNDDGVLPLDGLLHWDSFSITVPESQLHALVPYLRSLDPNAVAAMQGRALHAYNTYFRSADVYIGWALQLLRSRIWMYRGNE